MGARNVEIVPTLLRKRRAWARTLGITALIIVFSMMGFFSVITNKERARQVESLRNDFEMLLGKHEELKVEFGKIANDNAVHEIKQRKKRSSQEPRGTEYYGGVGGAVYVRWGRMSCPSNNETELVYKGVGGGSHYTHEGGVSNIQCLPNHPEWGRYDDGSTGSAFMYGMEYEDNMDNILDHSNVQGSIFNQNVPCAVCRNKFRPTALMIPGRFSCFEGWKLEYRGYIMAGHHTHKSASQFTCLDEAPEADPSGYRDDNGALFYRVEAVCGSLPCPPYVNNRELPCVVCTK